MIAERMMPEVEHGLSFKGSSEVLWDYLAKPGSIADWLMANIPEKNRCTEPQLNDNGFTLLEDYISHAEGWSKIASYIVKLLNANTYANA